MKGFILRILFLCAWIIGLFIAGVFIANYLSDPVTVYVFASIYSILVLAGAFFITAASFNEPISK
jgi:hypothetical protein